MWPMIAKDVSRVRDWFEYDRDGECQDQIRIQTLHEESLINSLFELLKTFSIDEEWLQQASLSGATEFNGNPCRL